MESELNNNQPIVIMPTATHEKIAYRKDVFDLI